MVKEITAKDIMRKSIVSIDEKETIAEAMRIMTRRGIKSLIIPREDGGYRIIGQNDIISIIGCNLYKDGLENLYVKNSYRIFRESVNPDDSIEEVASIIQRSKDSIVPVLDEGKLLGVISRGDIFKALR